MNSISTVVSRLSPSPEFPMKNLPALILCLLAGTVCAQAQLVSETFDQKPDSAKWNLSPQAKVLDGELVLNASGPTDGFPTVALVAKSGDAALNFTVKPIEIELTGITAGGTAAPANSVLIAILVSDVLNEMRARSYLKIRLSADGMLGINCADITGDRSRETTLARFQITLPVRRLTLRLSRENFHIKGVDAVRPFEQSGSWADKLDLAAWEGAKPFFIVKGVRRPGEGDAVVKLGGFTLNAVQ
jgi:hypothetical protein